MTVPELCQMFGNKFVPESNSGTLYYPRYRIWFRIGGESSLCNSDSPICTYYPKGYDFGTHGTSMASIFIPEHLTLYIDIKNDSVLYCVCPATTDYVPNYHATSNVYTEITDVNEIKNRINILLGDLKHVENVKHKIDLELEFTEES